MVKRIESTYVCPTPKIKWTYAKLQETALLYHTGSESSRIMLVLATNRPKDMDVAVLDRIDESVEFMSPGKSQNPS